MVKRVKDGEEWRPSRAADHNTVAAAGEFHEQTKISRPDPQILVPSYSLCRLTNSSGDDLPAGRVLQLGDLETDEIEHDSPWFDGLEPDPDGADTIAIALRPIAETENDECLLLGACFCRLNVNHVQHQYADVDSGSTLLQSKWHGRARIIWKDTASTGEQDAFVILEAMHHGPIKGIVTESGGIAFGTSGEVTVQWAGTDSSPADTVDAWQEWMASGEDAPEGVDVDLFWDPSQQRYDIHEIGCA